MTRGALAGPRRATEQPGVAMSTKALASDAVPPCATMRLKISAMHLADGWPLAQAAEL